MALTFAMDAAKLEDRRQQWDEPTELWFIAGHALGFSCIRWTCFYITNAAASWAATQRDHDVVNKQHCRVCFSVVLECSYDSKPYPSSQMVPV